MLYTYTCDDGHEFEVEQSMKDDALTRCPQTTGRGAPISLSEPGICGARCRRKIFPPAIAFKGAGWARDGYSPAGEKSAKRE